MMKPKKDTVRLTEQEKVELDSIIFPDGAQIEGIDSQNLDDYFEDSFNYDIDENFVDEPEFEYFSD